MAEWIQTHLQCPKCPSSDGYSINDRGWGKCFVCDANVKEFNDSEDPPPEKPMSSKKVKPLVDTGEFMALRKRKITEETARKFGYFIGEKGGKKVQVAPYRNQSGGVVAQKIRFPGKEFMTTGDFEADKLQLFGQHLWPSGGRKVVIVEGEIDAMSLSQAQGNKWPVVSLPSGAGKNVLDPLRANLEWLSTFQEVILMFDQDTAGQQSINEAAELLAPGQAKIATLPLKDPNEMLVEGKQQELIGAVWNAKEYRPDGLVEIDDIMEEIEKPVEWGLPWVLPSLTQYTYGRRYREVYGFGAGTGVGKTDLFTQQIEHDVNELGMKVGVVYLEQKPGETGTRIAGKAARKQFHIPDAGWTVEERREALQSLKGKVTFYDSFGQTEWAVVSQKIRYMVKAKGIRLIYLDHLTAMADPANEKESLELIMKEMAGLADELDCIIHFISHLSTPEGKPHEEGGRVMIRHFKGSRAIGFWSYFMFGLERNQQAEDPEEASTTVFRILKDRYTGQATGKTIPLGYDTDTGMLFEKTAEAAEDFGF